MSGRYESVNAEQAGAETDTFTHDRYRQMATWLPGAGKIVDVGCATGRGGKILKEINAQWTLIGLDCLQDRLARLPKDTYAECICSYTTAIDRPDASFQGIVAGEFIEHLEPADVDPTLAEFYRILSPEGRIVLTTPNPSYLKLKLIGGSVLGGAHLSEHHAKDLRARLRQIGFSNVVIRGTGRVSRILGTRFPVPSVYGSYLIVASKR